MRDANSIDVRFVLGGPLLAAGGVSPARGAAQTRRHPPPVEAAGESLHHE